MICNEKFLERMISNPLYNKLLNELKIMENNGILIKEVYYNSEQLDPYILGIDKNLDEVFQIKLDCYNCSIGVVEDIGKDNMEQLFKIYNPIFMEWQNEYLKIFDEAGA